MHALKSLSGALGLGLVGFYLGLGIVAILRVMLGYPDAWGGEINIVGGWVFGVIGWLIGIGLWGQWAREWFGLRTYTRKPTGWQRYFTFSTDHKVIGIQYLVTFIVVFLLAGAAGHAHARSSSPRAASSSSATGSTTAPWASTASSWSPWRSLRSSAASATTPSRS